MALKGSVTQTLTIQPAAAFALVTDIERLPEWNSVITRIVEQPEGCPVTVTWDLHPQTFWRRVLLARIRNQALKKETRASLGSLERAWLAKH